jgi:hypothetical protein
MERGEAIRRNAVLRAFFDGKDWDLNEEYVLKRAFVRRSRALLPAYEFLVDDEWDAVSGRSDLGRGDLVFTDGVGHFAVVELKFIDLTRTGPTARVKRTKSRGKVFEQAVIYACHILNGNPSAIDVLALYYTNEQPDRAIEIRRVTRAYESAPTSGIEED